MARGPPSLPHPHGCGITEDREGLGGSLYWGAQQSWYPSAMVSVRAMRDPGRPPHLAVMKHLCSSLLVSEGADGKLADSPPPSGNKPCFAAMLSGGATWGERTRCPPLCQPGGVSRGLVQSLKSHLCSAVTRHPPSPSGVGEREDIRCAPTGGGWHRDSGGGLARSRAAYGIGWGAYVASSHWF